MTPSERLNEVLRITGMNVKSLSERLGYNRPQGLYDVSAGRTKSLSPDLARKIITAFPEFNYIWLVTGEGEMLTERPCADTFTLTGDALKLFLNLSNTIVRQEENISRQEENISKLADMVNRLTGGIPKKDTAG